MTRLINNIVGQFVVAASAFVVAMVVCISLQSGLSPLVANLCTWALAATIIVHAIIVGRRSTFSIAFSVWFLLMTIPTAEPIAPLLYLRPLFASIAPNSQAIATDAFCICTSTVFGLSVSLMFGGDLSPAQSSPTID